MGTMPLPFLPLLSAINCSSQAPKGVHRESVINVILSFPETAALPKIAPSMTPGLAVKGLSALHDSAAALAFFSNFSPSQPASAAGTNPNAVNAEFRPPTCGSAENIFQNPLERASSSSFVPGSVMAMKCSPARVPKRFCANDQKYERKALISAVVPDLLATINKVLSIGAFFSLASTCSGSVESRMINSSPLVSLPRSER